MNWQLTNQSLCQIKGISPSLEIQLRKAGVRTVAQLDTCCCHCFSEKRVQSVREAVKRFSVFTAAGLTDAVVNAFPCGHRVRVVHDRYDATAFLDIETDGMSASSRITCISVCMSGKMTSYVRGRNLDEFLNVWEAAEVLVSFNGKRFDIPIIQREFGLSQVPAQVDLMDEARHYGLSGGLKSIERMISFARDPCDCENGEDAVHFWNEYVNGNQESLADLVAYNRADVLSLVALYRYLLPLSLENGNFVL